MGLFDDAAPEKSPRGPLADRIRPETLEQFVGQTPVVGPGTALRRAIERDDLRSMMEAEEDPELVSMARSELADLEERLPGIEETLRLMLLPRDPEDAKNAIVEIRAGTGGDEASLFAGDLYRLYTRFAEAKGWRVELIDASAGTQGGFKEIVFSVSGADAYGTMKYESGVHRVQRIPTTETSGRIHTSTVTVAVLPEAEEVDIEIKPEDLKFDVFRASGAGGQHVNTSSTAVRVTHIPSGIQAKAQEERSQHRNKALALARLMLALEEKDNKAKDEQQKMNRER